MRQKVGVVATMLIGAFVLTVLAGVLPIGSLSMENSRNVEASSHELHPLNAVERTAPQTEVDPLEATKAYVNDAIAAYREDPEAALAYYRSNESIVNDPPGLYLTLLDGDIIKVNPAFPSAEGTGISWRDDPLGNMYGARLAAADEDGVVVEYLIPISSQDYTYRKKTAWAIRADVPDIDNPGSETSLVFSAGWLDLETDVESTFTEAQRAVGEVIEARGRVQSEGAIATLNHYKTSGSIDGEYYVWLAYPTGRIAADAAMPELEGTNIADAYPPEVAQDILGVQSLETRWVSHMWPNPETGQEELKHTYVTRFFGFYIISGYYDEAAPVVGPRAAAQAYVEEAIRAYREDPEAAKEYYQSEASVDRENDLYLILIDGTEIIVNGGFPGVVGDDITSRIGVDAVGKEYGKEIAAAGETGRFVTYLISDPFQNYTLYRKHTWAIKADGLIFAAGSWDRNEDVESTLEPHEDVVAAIYKAGARFLVFGGDQAAFLQLVQYYNTPASIDGERYVFLVTPDGIIVADATMPNLRRTNIADLQASDDPELGRKIAAVQEGEELWISHMWRNPATGQEELKHTYVTRFRGIIFGSGYYGDELPPAVEDPWEATQAYVRQAIAAYRADPEAAKEYYRDTASFDEDLGLYLLLLQEETIVVNGVFPLSEGSDISWRADPLGHQYGEKLADANEDGVEVSYLIPIPGENYTFREKNAWAIRADGLVFSAGWIDKEKDVEATLTDEQRAVGAVIKARARVQKIGLQSSLAYYRTPASIDGEFYVWWVFPGGNIAADATMPHLQGTQLSDLQSSDDPELGKKIAAVQSREIYWISHMWQNPATGQEELKHTYVSRFLNFYLVSGYYDDEPLDACFTVIEGSGTYTGTWDETCLSDRPAERGSGDRYARFYTFTLDEDATISITLTSGDDPKVDTYLYLIRGDGKSGAEEDSNDDISSDNTDSQILAKPLGAGTYTIEATTYDAQSAGNFTLVVEIEVTGEPPEPPPPDVTYIAISSGANHVCAIASDGSIMCWGNDDYGQVSERPTSGDFTQISSGDNHTCALRDDGAVICWGSIDVP